MPFDLSQISLGSANNDERLVVEHFCTKYEYMISKSQWDIGLFDTEPAHIRIKAGFSPKYTRQPAIIVPSIRKVAASMIIELERRGLIKSLEFPFINVKKTPKEK